MGLLDGTTQQSYYQGGDLGNYQFTSLDNIINQFMMVYVGEDKLISKASRTDVAFHAQRAIQELSFDTFKSCKSQEITLPPSLTMMLPHDYVNYIKLTWSDSAGIEHIIYPASKTSNPKNIKQEDDGSYYFDTTILPPYGANNADLSLWSLTNTGTGTIVYDSTDETIDFTGVDIDARATFDFGSVGQLVGFTSPSVFTPYQLQYTITNLGAGSQITPYLYNAAGYWISLGEVIADGTYTVDVDWTNISVNPSSYGYSNTLSFYASQPSGTFSTFSVGNVTFIDPGEDGIISNDLFYEIDSDTWTNYKTSDSNDNTNNYDDGIYDLSGGERYGIHPEHSQANGSFYIDCNSGKIHFSSNINGRTVVLHYISDGLGTDAEMKVHKFAEEAMYKWITYAILSSKPNIQEYIVRRYQKEKFAAIRNAKLRLSNIKLEELTQILRGKSKWIKH